MALPLITVPSAVTMSFEPSPEKPTPSLATAYTYP